MHFAFYIAGPFCGMGFTPSVGLLVSKRNGPEVAISDRWRFRCLQRIPVPRCWYLSLAWCLSSVSGTPAFHVAPQPPCLFCGTVPPIRNAPAPPAHSLFRFPLIEAREDIRFTATRDPLTTLWNRGVILELLERELVRSHREQVSGDTLFRRPPERFPSR